MAEDQGEMTVESLRKSFYYGVRSDLNFKFLADLSDDEFASFLTELLTAVGHSMDGEGEDEALAVAQRWQTHGYSGHLGDPAEFRHRKDTTPMAALTKPLSESRLLLLTSSGHFVDGNDPKPFGLDNMTQAEAEARVGEFMKEPPVLSPIPVNTPFEEIRVRHGGYPVQAALKDPQVVLPLEHLRRLSAEGVIGELVDTAYSFVGATSQGHLKKTHAPQWAEMAKDHGADAALLIPI